MQEASPTHGAILVVDDVPEMRLLLKDWLEGLGYSVLEAEDGEAATEVAQSRLPKFILMDIGLPKQSGISAVYRIRKHPGLQNVPIVAMTAYTNPDLYQEAIKAGCVEVLTKPLDTDRLKKLLNNLL
ncbi:MAG: response regulator [Rubrivivax sp.]|nr:response regulator [Pyrinomonadaceae bacterium]